jgi:hypothetical protein
MGIAEGPGLPGKSWIGDDAHLPREDFVSASRGVRYKYMFLNWGSLEFPSIYAPIQAPPTGIPCR